MVSQAPAANHQNLMIPQARQTGKTTINHEIMHDLLQGIYQGGSHRVNLILFCIRANYSGLDKHPAWNKLWYREVIHYRIMSGNAIWGGPTTYPG